MIDPLHRTTAQRGTARRAFAALLALALALALPAPALAAEGGPALNVPVPAGTKGGTPPVGTVTAKAPASAAQAATTPAATTTTPASSAHPATRSSGVSKTAIALAAAGVLLIIGCVVWALALRFALAEAGYRASATWAELGDWMRLGP